MADKAFITPKVLKWARESARMSVETAAGKVSVDLSKLVEWEAGVSQPTINQAQTLAKAYKRSFAIFFLPEIPRDFQPLQDFRRDNSKSLGTASVFIIREIQQKQSWISDLNKEDNADPLPFVGRFSVMDDPQIVANNILQTLGIDPHNYDYENRIKEWIDKSEAKGIFISRTSFIHSRLKIDSDEIKGFAIADKYAPFVFINSDDWTSSQLFTLVHELVHIWIAQSGISNEIEPEIKGDGFNPVELFCNKVAANVLMPADIIRSLELSTFDYGANVFKASGLLGVSSFALLIRAFSLQIISREKYNQLKKEADLAYKIFLIKEQEKKAKQKEQSGGPNPYLLRLNKNSKLFTQIVLDAFRGGFIEPTQASSLLNTAVNNFSKLEAFIYQ